MNIGDRVIVIKTKNFDDHTRYNQFIGQVGTVVEPAENFGFLKADGGTCFVLMDKNSPDDMSHWARHVKDPDPNRTYVLFYFIELALFHDQVKCEV